MRVNPIKPSRRVFISAGAFVCWAIAQTGLGQDLLAGELFNEKGWGSFGEFWKSLFSPKLAGSFLKSVIEASQVTLSFAVLGTVVSMVTGMVVSFTISELSVPNRWVQRIARVVMAAPRAFHEVVFALLLIEAFGFDPFVAIISIGVPYGVIVGKVFAETVDEADRRPFQNLRLIGAGRLSGSVFGGLASVKGELVSYAFYRFECAIRSAAVLGVVGVGGIGQQLDLSFETLRYREIWTYIFALMLMSGFAEYASGRVRLRLSGQIQRETGQPKRPNPSQVGVVLKRMASAAQTTPAIAFTAVVTLMLCFHWSGLNLAQTFSRRRWKLLVELITDLWPPSLGGESWRHAVSAAAETVAMSVLAIAAAAILATLFALLVARPPSTAPVSPISAAARSFGRMLLLLFRAVPAPVWAFLVVLVVFPGPVAGAIALAVYNLGILGRLIGEVIEERSGGVADSLRLIGVSEPASMVFGVLPEISSRVLGLVFYRWEVIVRETVIVGVVGAGGLGQLIQSQLVARDFQGVAGSVCVLGVIAVLVDFLGSIGRKALR